jgi:hypothetical protein
MTSDVYAKETEMERTRQRDGRGIWRGGQIEIKRGRGDR